MESFFRREYLTINKTTCECSHIDGKWNDKAMNQPGIDEIVRFNSSKGQCKGITRCCQSTNITWVTSQEKKKKKKQYNRDR